ncbi:MAG TPA: ImmA/IrrE family metallo-endopeptidase [Gaiella sp.]
MPSDLTRYTDPRAHDLRAAYVAAFGGDEIPVPVESIAEDLLGLLVEQRDLGDCSGMLIPGERLVLVNAAEGAGDGTPTSRQRFTIAHELGHWVCHARRGADPSRSYCRASDLALDADRALEREANVFGAELLMPELAVREAWVALPDRDALAARFGVSALAAQWRLYSFGLGDRPG